MASGFNNGAVRVSITSDQSHLLPDEKLWVCEDTSCTGQARAKINPLACPVKGCNEELLMAPLSRQSS